MRLRESCPMLRWPCSVFAAVQYFVRAQAILAELLRVGHGMGALGLPGVR
jgi:hypothetical protein